MEKLIQLENIGKKLESQLNEVNIFTPQQLIQLGSKQAWLKIKKIDPSACYNRLCALEGAIRGIKWPKLDEKVKEDLKVFYNSNKK